MLRRVGWILLLIFSAGSPVFGQNWAEKMFEVRRHDFGSVARGAKTEFEFVLSNIYVEDIHIASVGSSCGCTSPRIKKPLLKTYEKGAIIASYNTRAFMGRKGATITVTFDRPLYAQVQLQVSGYIRSDVVFDPGSVQLGSVDQGNPADRKVAVSYAGRSNWKILEVRSANPHVSARVIQNSRRGGWVLYDLVVHLDETAPAGYLRDHLMLITNDRQRTQIPLLVEGHVLPAVTVSPASLFMGVVEPGERVTKQLVVRAKKPFRILSITCDDEAFEFGDSAGDVPKLLHVIPVTFVAGENSGKVGRTIRIETDLGATAPELAAYAIVLSP